MTDVELVHPVAVDEMVPWMSSMATTFLESPADFVADAGARAPFWEPERAWGARADGRWVATLRTIGRNITVPGTRTLLPTDGLTNVTVAATHRRQGLLTAMITESLQTARDRGEAVSALVAAEWPIYGRYGYAPASDGTHYTVESRRPGARLISSGSGSVRQVEAAELGVIAPSIFETGRALRAGNIDRPQFWWNRTFALDGYPRVDKREHVYVVHEGPDGIDGYAIWHSSGTWGLTGTLGEITVTELTTANQQAYVGLWQYLLGVDVVDKIQLRHRPIDEPLKWLLADGRMISPVDRVDFMWLRILDVRATLSARRYATPGTLVLEVVDHDGAGFATGRYLLDAAEGGAQCKRTTRSADLRMSQRALAAAYLGGSSLRVQSLIGLVDELRPGALDRADAMFATALAPYCQTGF